MSICSSLFFFFKPQGWGWKSGFCVWSPQTLQWEKGGHYFLTWMRDSVSYFALSDTTWWEVRAPHYYLVSVVQAPHLAFAGGSGTTVFSGAFG